MFIKIPKYPCLISLDNITSIEGTGDKTKIHTVSGETFTIETPFKKFMQKLLTWQVVLDMEE